ncbi:MAG: porin family protein [Bacteroidales bacterium]|nr:porin family protein [Bacteroidales bacterium]MCF8389081.1 porin family protein [Bacteroidales bacterium]
MIKFLKKSGKVLLIAGLMVTGFAFTANSQILLGPDYGLEAASLNGNSHTRSGGQLSASYFINPNIAFRLTISAFSKELVDADFATIANWTVVSQLFSVNYYFLTSNLRPYVSFGGGLYNDKISDENVVGYYNDNRLYVAPEVGFLASVSPKLKLNGGIRYNVVFDTDGSLLTFIGLKVPLVSH